MDVIKAIKNRRSIRNFTPKKPNKADITKLLGIARFSPSANNSQPWRFLIIKDKDVLTELEEETVSSLNKKYPAYNLQSHRSPVLHGASCLLLIVAKPGYWSSIDCVICAYTIMLAGPSYGLGTCWMGLVQEFLQKNKSFSKKIGIPNEMELFACLAIGYPDPNKKRKMPKRNKPKIIKGK